VCCGVEVARVEYYINRRSNKRLNATAHSVALINLVQGGALSAALGVTIERPCRREVDYETFQAVVIAVTYYG
jgi:hypothetical protein